MELLQLLMSWALTLAPPLAEPPELLPPPREVKAEVILVPLVPIDPYYLPDPYWRMRTYATDRYGRLGPRVIYTPYVPFYLYSGEPYPFMPVKGVP